MTTTVSTTTFLRKNNSNLHACEEDTEHNGPLWRALRKERFRKSDPSKDRQFHLLSLIHTPDSPYDAVDFKMDLEKFRKTLSTDLQPIFDLFMQGFSPKQIAAQSEWAAPTVYRKLQLILSKFKTFYSEGE